MPTETKRRLLDGIRVGKPNDIGLQDLRTLARNHPVEFMRKVQTCVDDGKIGLSGLHDLRGLYRALADVEVGVMLPDAIGNQRAVTTAAFPILVGTTVVKAVNDAYEAVPVIGDQLVTELEDSKAVTVIARIAADNKDQDRVKEGDDFPEVSVTEDTVEIGEWRNGRILRITAEAIERNDLANIVERVNFLGDYAAKFVEKHTLKLVTDLHGSGSSAAAPYAYRPSGSGTAMFSATANTPGTRAPSGTRYESNALADETDLTNARTRLKAMRDDSGDPILIDPNALIVLVPEALIETAYKIKNSELLPSAATWAVSTWGPKGQWAGWKPMVSNYLDLWSTNAWYMGDPQKQFRRKWGLRMEYVTLGENTQAYLNSRIAFQARIAWNCHIGAVDYVYWVQNLSGTTAPSE